MQPLVLHPPSLTTGQFGHSRFTSGPERLPLNRSWSTNARGCSPRAAVSRQPMSDSPPEEDEPPVTSKEPQSTYPPTSEPAGTTTRWESTAINTTTAADPAPTAATTSNTTATTAEDVLSSVPPTTTTTTTTTTTAQPPRGPGELLPTQAPPRYGKQTSSSYIASPRSIARPAYPVPALETIAGPATRSLTQKSTRRTKAHVASACVNCKKKHLGCDPARPCRRCVLAGKASSCVDVTHKKRGRPPLKAEDSSITPFTSHVDHPAVSTEAQPSIGAQRGTMHRTTSSRELRPMTDLQSSIEPGVMAPMPVSRGGQPYRWSASVFPLTRPMDLSPTMSSTMDRRPFSASGPPTYATPPYPPPAFIPISSGFTPMFKTGLMPPGLDRRFQPYATPALPPPLSPQPHHLPAGIPSLPYPESPPSSLHHPLSDPRLPPGPREPYLESPLRLPPIHQATASPGTSHHAHRLSDPYPATWTSREWYSREPRSPGPFFRPIGSIFTHSPPPPRSSSQAGPLDPVPRHPGPVELPSPVTLGQSSSTEERATTKTSAETEPEERPVKRRKMALDDMVNG